MNISDFKKDYDEFISNDRFLFENDIVSFYYRWMIQYHEDSYDGLYKTDYELMLLVDDESIHPNHKDDLFDDVTCSFLVKRTSKRKEYDEAVVNKLIEIIPNININNIIKKNKYNKIISIINGFSLYI